MMHPIEYALARKRQVGGKHYTQLGIEPWDIIKANKLNFWEGNIIKYVLRRKGNRLEDLEKAKHYLDFLIEYEKETKQ